MCVSLGAANHAPQGGPHMSLDTKLRVAKIAKIPRETIMKRRSPAIGREALAAEIASLSMLGVDELRARWKAMFANAPSRDRTRPFLPPPTPSPLQQKAFH